MNKLIQQKEEAEVSPWARDDWRWVKENGTSNGTRPRDPATREDIT